MSSSHPIPASPAPWLAWLERELSPTPGRGAATFRVVVATTLVILISMTMEVPFASVSAFLVLFISKRNLASTLVAGTVLIAGVTLAIGATLLLLPYIVDQPELRVPAMALLLLGGMYLSRVFIIGPLAFITGFIMALALGEVSTLPGNGDLIVRGCLWIWVAAVYSIVLTVIAGRFILPKTQLTPEAAAPPRAVAKPKAKFSLFKPGAFADPSHLRFAIKVTLAAMFCYLIYTAVDWPGIKTAFVTCCICALESTGASLRKMYLRITGCLIGGALGVITLIYVVPHMQGIVSLLLVSAVVTGVAAWIALGSERISYAGVQMNFAFYVCLLQGYEPPTDLNVIRDRVVGILLGIVTISIVFRYLWPERTADRLRTSLAQLLRQVAEFVTSPEPEKRAALTAQFDLTQRLTEQANFELDLHCPGEVAGKRRLDDLIRQAQTHFLAAAAAVPTHELRERLEISRRLEAEAQTLTLQRVSHADVRLTGEAV